MVITSRLVHTEHLYATGTFVQLRTAPCWAGEEGKEWKSTFKREIKKIAYTCGQDLHVTLAGSRYSTGAVAALWPSQKILILHNESKKENGLEKEM